MRIVSSRSHNSQSGFSLIDIMLTLALIFLMAGLSAPSIAKFVNNYKLRMAVSDLSSYIHKSRSISAKNNIDVIIDFNPEGFIGYRIADINNNEIAVVGFDSCTNSEIRFSRCYNGNVIYKRPLGGELAHPETLTIKANGLSKRGFAYITNREKQKYYRVGIVSASGLVGVEKWNGSDWE